MQQRALGRTGLTMSVLGMGCSRLGTAVSRDSDRDAEAAVERALELGITFFDTADVYGRGRSETILARVLRRTGADAVVATKCGLVRTPATAVAALRASPASTIRGLLRSQRRHREYSTAYVERAVDASLRRLRRDRVDILLLHSPPRSVLEHGAAAEAFARLKASGKARACGVSVRGDTDEVGDALAALDVPGLDCIELTVNLCATEQVCAAVAAAAERGVGVVARQPFAAGAFLREPAHRPETVAACLQFTLSVPGVNLVIAGMTQPGHVTANVDALAAPVPDDSVRALRSSVCSTVE